MIFLIINLTDRCGGGFQYNSDNDEMDKIHQMQIFAAKNRNRYYSYISTKNLFIPTETEAYALIAPAHTILFFKIHSYCLRVKNILNKPIDRSTVR